MKADEHRARQAPFEQRYAQDPLRMRFELDTDAPPELVDKLLSLTERYCVVLQTLRHAPLVQRSQSGGARGPA